MRSVLVSCLAGALLAGCASTGYVSEIDEQRVAQVEREARRDGRQVIWLSYPRIVRKATAADS
ncbi:hypothetical protein [Chitinimonas lacunae]|uniref:Uncharacterized protein n=1 Tax=Chitinimonas lacunae TaxID=1963018 RepID=A0ABV8MPF1_9NEIS